MSTSPESETPDDETPTFEEMASNLGEQRRALLRVLHQADDSTLNTSRLRQRADVPTGSIGHHLDLLERWGLIEETGREYAGRGSKAKVWTVTDDGETFVADYLDSEHGPPASVDDLARRVEAMEDDIDDVKRLMVRLAVEADLMGREKAEELLD